MTSIMTSVPFCVSQTLINTFANISTNEMVTEQTISDVFKDEHMRYVTRKFTLESKLQAKKIRVNLKMIETLPDKTIMRLNLDFVNDIYEDDGKLVILSDSCTVMFDIADE